MDFQIFRKLKLAIRKKFRVFIGAKYIMTPYSYILMGNHCVDLLREYGVVLPGLFVVFLMGFPDYAEKVLALFQQEIEDRLIHRHRIGEIFELYLHIIIVVLIDDIP